MDGAERDAATVEALYDLAFQWVACSDSESRRYLGCDDFRAELGAVVRQRLASLEAEVERLRGALTSLLRHVRLEAKDDFLDEHACDGYDNVRPAVAALAQATAEERTVV